MPVKKIKETNLTVEGIAAKGMEYYMNKQNIKNLEKNVKELRPDLENYVNAHGSTQSSGTKIAVLPFADKSVVLKNVYRCSSNLVAEAVDIAKANKELEGCVETVEYFREDVLEYLVSEGKVSEEMLKRLYETKESYAFSVDVKAKVNEKDLEV